MDYKVIPYPETSKPVADLDAILKRESKDGFEYLSHQYSDKFIPGSSGCFGVGEKPDTTAHIGFVVFRKS